MKLIISDFKMHFANIKAGFKVGKKGSVYFEDGFLNISFVAPNEDDSVEGCCTLRDRFERHLQSLTSQDIYFTVTSFETKTLSRQVFSTTKLRIGGL